jgi:hypothetical protein
MSTQSVRRRNGSPWLYVAVGVVGFTLTVVGFQLAERQASEDATATGPAPVQVEELEGSDLSLVTLTPRAAERAGLRTARVRSEPGAVRRRIVPYSAVLYDEAGAAWVYTKREGLTFVRAPVTITSIEGDTAALSAGPAPGTIVAAVGAAELYGAEFEVDH